MKMKAIIVVEQDTSGWWIAEAINLPFCVARAQEKAEALAQIDDAVNAWLGLTTQQVDPLSKA